VKNVSGRRLFPEPISFLAGTFAAFQHFPVIEFQDCREDLWNR
jgi:hypothetical protein